MNSLLLQVGKLGAAGAVSEAVAGTLTVFYNAQHSRANCSLGKQLIPLTEMYD